MSQTVDSIPTVSLTTSPEKSGDVVSTATVSPTAVPLAVVSPTPASLEAQGYDRARKEVRDAIVWIAEEFLQSRPNDSPSARRDVYAFIAHLDRRLHRLPSPDEVEGGLGI